jgi:hypothetical protein
LTLVRVINFFFVFFLWGFNCLLLLDMVFSVAHFVSYICKLAWFFVVNLIRAFRFIFTQTGLQEPFPKLNEWLHRVTSRPAVARGFDVPDPSDHIKNDFKIAMSKEEAEEKAKEATKWIMASKTDGK